MDQVGLFNLSLQFLVKFAVVGMEIAPPENDL